MTLLCAVAGAAEIPDIRIATINSLRTAALPIYKRQINLFWNRDAVLVNDQGLTGPSVAGADGLTVAPLTEGEMAGVRAASAVALIPIFLIVR